MVCDLYVDTLDMIQTEKEITDRLKAKAMPFIDSTLFEWKVVMNEQIVKGVCCCLGSKGTSEMTEMFPVCCQKFKRVW